MVNIGNDWDELLKTDFESDWYQNLRQFLITEYSGQIIYPNMYDIFNALKVTSYANVKVVILGQDPYFNPGQAHGLSFSVLPNAKLPPSLQNIYKELNSDLGINIPNNGYLLPWAKQGVLLLNSILTVREGMPLSHKNKGWELLTDHIISLLNEREKPLVFILWGNPAKAKKDLITNSIHKVIVAPHPSPLSAHYGFFGSKPFSKTNTFLTDNGVEPINWELKNI